MKLSPPDKHLNKRNIDKQTIKRWNKNEKIILPTFLCFYDNFFLFFWQISSRFSAIVFFLFSFFYYVALFRRPTLKWFHFNSNKVLENFYSCLQWVVSYGNNQLYIKIIFYLDFVFDLDIIFIFFLEVA